KEGGKSGPPRTLCAGRFFLLGNIYSLYKLH
ncbi:uncharacterized protein METZ01_LOCUS340651, partial [marine metagenome]